MAKAIKAVVSGTNVMFDIQHSKIGYSYPRMFVEIGQDKYANVDFTLGHAFGMSRSNWDDWMSDAVNVDEVGGIEGFCKEIGIKYEALSSVLAELKAA